MKRRGFAKAGKLARAALPLARAGILTRPKALQRPSQHVFRASRFSKCGLLLRKLSGFLSHESAFWLGGQIK